MKRKAPRVRRPAHAKARRARPEASKPVVDIHAHFFPEAYLKLLEDEGGPFGMGLRRDHPEGPTIVAGSVTFGPLSPAFYDPEVRLKAMNTQKVQVHALSLTAPMVYPAEGPLGLKLARAWNDSAAEMARAYPDRFVGLATLPMQDPAAAVGELDRAVRSLGCRGVYLGTNVRGKDLSDPSFLPVFERIHALGIPVFLHPVNVIGEERLKRHHLHNLLGNPFDTAIAAAKLIFTGILDRFPRLEVCLPHAGGALPYLIGRLNRGWKVRQECRELPRSPSTYLRRFTYDTISHAPASLRYLIGLVGADRIMLGSDYCFDMGYERPVDWLTALKLPKVDQERILGGTAVRLLRLG